MGTKRAFSFLTKNYNLYYILENILGTNDLDPVLVHSPNGESIGFNIEGRVVRLYIKSLTDELVLIDEAAEKISETYINVYTGQTETIQMERKEDTLKVSKIEKFFELQDSKVSYIEEDHRTYSFDKIRKIYNLPNADLEFCRMKKLLNTFKFIEEDSLVEGIPEDKHDTVMVYDNNYMKTTDADVYMNINGQVYKYRYGDGLVKAINIENFRRLTK